MHLHLWRLRHRHRLLLEQGLIPNGPIYTMQAVPKLTIEPEVLDTFPVRVVGAPPSSVSVVDRSSAANLAGAPPSSVSVVDRSSAANLAGALKRSNSNKSVRSVKAVENAEAVAKGRRSKIEDPGTTFGDEDDEGTCVICLDEFEEGDKTASCPLCKRDCSRPLDAEGREVDGYDKSQDSSVAVDPPEPAVPRSGRWNWARMVGRPQRAGVQAWSGAV
ncbi:hypothetical protein BC938DRAFT_478820 [Jimgerdemannia flammicorona]|uniref:Uncharacterized protein n=1 Tax=Jimgerdemannia flammicorona TaxID=994334 RepID=A0A433P4U7_9FUNG|nr:hypothetical protein BC938DRAFT_478820 [Jimgerdemannia flammicorona]